MAGDRTAREVGKTVGAILAVVAILAAAFIGAPTLLGSVVDLPDAAFAWLLALGAVTFATLFIVGWHHILERRGTRLGFALLGGSVIFFVPLVFWLMWALNQLGESGSDEYAGGTASEATGVCQEFLRRNAKGKLPVELLDLTVRGKDGWWVVSGTASVGKRADRAQVPFDCQVGRSSDDSWSIISVCLSDRLGYAHKRYLALPFSYGCDPADQQGAVLPPGYGY